MSKKIFTIIFLAVAVSIMLTSNSYAWYFTDFNYRIPIEVQGQDWNRTDVNDTQITLNTTTSPANHIIQLTNPEYSQGAEVTIYYDNDTATDTANVTINGYYMGQLPLTSNSYTFSINSTVFEAGNGVVNITYEINSTGEINITKAEVFYKVYQPDFQVKITVNTTYFIEGDKMKSDCSDIRFTWLNETSNEEQEIPYWIEGGCNTSETIIWVKVPKIPANDNATIYMYYGNPSATSQSNGDDVFILYEDWENWSGTTTNPTWSGWTTEDKDTDSTYEGDIQVSDAVARSGSYSVKKINGLAAVSRSDLSLQDVVVEVAVYIETYGSSGTERAAILNVYDGSTYRLFGYDSYASTSYYFYRIGSTYYTTSKPLYPAGEWHVYGIASTSSGSKFYVDYEEVASTSNVIEVKRVVIGSLWNADDSCVAYFDDLRVRKYTDPEPTTSPLTAQEEYYNLSKATTVSPQVASIKKVGTSITTDTLDITVSIIPNHNITINITDPSNNLKTTCNGLTDSLGKFTCSYTLSSSDSAGQWTISLYDSNATKEGSKTTWVVKLESSKNIYYIADNKDTLDFTFSAAPNHNITINITDPSNNLKYTCEGFTDSSGSISCEYTLALKDQPGTWVVNVSDVNISYANSLSLKVGKLFVQALARKDQPYPDYPETIYIANNPDTIFAKVKALANYNITINITDPNGVVKATTNGLTDANGEINITYDLQTTDAYGTWKVEIYDHNNSVSKYLTFKVGTLIPEDILATTPFLGYEWYVGYKISSKYLPINDSYVTIEYPSTVALGSDATKHLGNIPADTTQEESNVWILILSSLLGSKPHSSVQLNLTFNDTYGHIWKVTKTFTVYEKYPVKAEISASLARPGNTLQIAVTFTNSTGHATNVTSYCNITILSPSMTELVSNAPMSCGYVSSAGACVYNYSYTLPSTEGEYTIIIYADPEGTPIQAVSSISVFKYATQSQLSNLESKSQAVKKNITDVVIPAVAEIQSKQSKIKSLAETAVSKAQQILDKVRSATDEGVEEVQKKLNSALSSLEDLLDKIEELRETIMNKIKQIKRTSQQSTEEAVNELQKALQQLKQAIQSLQP